MRVAADARLAFCFPGQGSQSVGMGRAFHDASPAARAVFEEASDALGFDVAKLCFEGPESELQLTANTQPAVLTVSVAGTRLLAERGLAPAVVGGHSLGEYTALVAAGSLAFADAVAVVRRRGEFMQEAVPVGTGAMAAILGVEPPVVEEICRDAAQGEVLDVANINSPGQIVVAGHRGAVERAVALAPARGGKRSVMLPVSAPFHCRLMTPAAERLAAVLAGVRAADPQLPGRPERGRRSHDAVGRRPTFPDPPGDGAGPLDGLRRAHGAGRLPHVHRGGAGEGPDRAAPADRRLAHGHLGRGRGRTGEGADRPGRPIVSDSATPGRPLEGRVALVTGGTRGIGRAIVEALLDDGAAVAFTGRDAAKVEEIAAALDGRAGKAVGLVAEMGRGEDVQRIVTETDKRFDRLDLLVNNAGITKDGLLIRMKDADWDEVLGVDLRAAFQATRAAARLMIRQRSGRIVNVTSVAGVMGTPGQANYAAAKAGLIGLTKSTARELAHWGILVNAVAPGLIETDMAASLSAEMRQAYVGQVPLKRIGTAREVAEVVRFLASEGASYITGQVIHVNGGLYM